jgi:putative transposase
MADDLRRTLSIPAVCALYGVSRQTGDQWLERDLTAGPPGLEARARTPCSRPHQTPQHVVEAIMEGRGRHPAWGAKTRWSLLPTRQPRGSWPGRSTGCEILRRRGLVPQTRHRRLIGHPGKPTTLIAAPTEVWRADCHGPCQTGDGLSGDPLTGAAGYRRVRRGGQTLASTRVAEATPVCTRLFNAFGFPKRLRPDTGVPLATNPLGRRSPLSAWWVRRGICPERIAPGQPPQNGRPERRPRTLKADTTRPPARTRRAQPRQVERFREACNGPRPHEALDLPPPASCDDPSPRPMPTRWPPLDDPDRFAVRDVSAHGGIRWNHPWGNVSQTCIGAYVGLEAIDAGIWHVSFGPLTRGRRLERHRRIEEV